MVALAPAALPLDSALPSNAGNTMNPLAPLPDEIILEIFEHLIQQTPTYRFGRQGSREVPHATFAALALTCRYLYPLAKMFLYSEYKAPWNDPVLPFLKQIALEPGLAVRVNEIHVEHYCPQIVKIKEEDIFDMPSFAKIITSVPLIDLSSAVKSAALSYEHRWLEHLHKRPQDIELALLILRSRNLQKLVITKHIRRSWDTTDAISFEELVELDPILNYAKNLGAQPSPAHDFSKLANLDLRVRGVCLTHIAIALCLPSLTALSLQDFVYDATLKDLDAKLPWSIQAGTSKLQHIYILYSMIPSDALVRLIEACQVVKSFSFLVGRIETEAAEWYKGTLGALRLHQTSLERLAISTTEDDAAPQEYGIEAYTPFDGLRAMSFLHFLKMDYVVLMGKPEGIYEPEPINRAQHPNWNGYASTLAKVLPPQLSHLSLVMNRSSLTWNVDYDSQLQTLLSDGQLRELHVEYFHNDSQAEFPVRFFELQRTCDKYGVEFGYEIDTCIVDEEDFNDIVTNLVAMGMHEALAIASNVEVELGDYDCDILEEVQKRFKVDSATSEQCSEEEMYVASESDDDINYFVRKRMLSYSELEEFDERSRLSEDEFWDEEDESRELDYPQSEFEDEGMEEEGKAEGGEE